MKSASLVLPFIFSFSCGSYAAAASTCAGIFETFVMTEAIQNSIDATISDLARLRIYLDLRQVQGATTTEFTALSAAFQLKETLLLAYLEGHQIMTSAELTAKIKTVISEMRNEGKESPEIKEKEIDSQRAQQRQEFLKLAIDGRYAIFHSIRPGFFMMGEQDIAVPVNITRPFSMMATVTTQWIWQKVYQMANDKWPNTYLMRPNPSHFEGETHPVESVTPYEIEAWISALNKLSVEDSARVKEIIPDHTEGDVYRLPTEAEWEFVASARGETVVFYFENKVPNESDLYEWYVRNSDRQTQPVAQKLPLEIDGQSFYDMIGNVKVLVSDIVEDQRVHRGAHWGAHGLSLRSSTRELGSTAMGSSALGFRLVREVRP